MRCPKKAALYFLCSLFALLSFVGLSTSEARECSLHDRIEKPQLTDHTNPLQLSDDDNDDEPEPADDNSKSE